MPGYQIFDTHNHCYFPSFRDNFSEHLEQARQSQVTKQILVGIDEASCHASLKLAQSHDDFLVAVGLHPCDVDQLNVRPGSKYENYVGIPKSFQNQHQTHHEYFNWLDQLATDYPQTIVAFGETGFDQFHRQDSTLLKLQTECFERHLNLCLKHDKALIIHSRGAGQATIKFLERYKAEFKQIRFVWHCFTEDQATAKLTLSLGGYLGIGGVSTYPKSTEIRDIIKNTPLEKLVIETDAPFLVPHTARKAGHKLNHPQYLTEVLETIAHTKEEKFLKVAQQVYSNSIELFNLKDG